MFGFFKNKKAAHTDFPEVLKTENISHNNIAFRNAFFALSPNDVTEETANYITAIYLNSKLQEIRHKALALLYDKGYATLKTFFFTVYKKERAMHLKLLALRGLAQFVAEDEIKALLKPFNATLQKWPQTTPYNYTEYEMLRGANALPYLIKRYGYTCFIETMHIIETQYNALPAAFKGHFSVAESGDIIQLRNPDQVAKLIADFFRQQENKNNSGT